MRLFAPEGATSANVEGAIYKPGEDGTVEVQVPSHEAVLLSLGFTKTKPAPPAPPADVHADDEGRAAAPAADAGPVSILTIRVGSLYPAVAAALEAAGIDFEVDETATDVLTMIDRHLGEGGSFGALAVYEPEPGRYPFVAACLADGGLDSFEDLDAVFAAIEKRAPADAFNDDGSRKEFVLGDFVRVALEKAGLTDLSDTQAVLDAIEEAFAPFAAFDPDGDNKPGGTAPATETDPDAIPAEIDALKGPELKKQLEDLGVAVPSGMAVPKMKTALRDELAKKAAEAANASATSA